MSVATPTVDQETYDVVYKSFSNCCTSPDFYDDFYEIFLKSSDKIAPMFANTDMPKQKMALRSGLTMLIQFVNDSATAKMAVNKLAKTHKRDAMNIEPAMYPFWVDSLMKAVEKHDPDFDGNIEAMWRQVLQVGIDEFIRQY